MRYSVLGRTKMTVSVLGAGSNALRNYSQGQANFIYNHALDRGINFIVTSAAYKVVEPMISEAISHRRGEFHLATTTDHRSAKGARMDIENSLKTFKTDFIDLYQVGGVRHQRAIDLALAPGGAMEALEEAKGEGRIGAIGITGHVPDVLARAISTGRFDAVFFILNMANLYALEELVPLAKDMGVGTMVMRPLAHGALKPAARALRFALSSGVDTVFCGMYSKEEIDQAMAVAEAEPSEHEGRRLMLEANSLPRTGCRLCNLCEPCPRGIAIPFLMELFHYRAKYGLLPGAEARWVEEAKKAGACDDCGNCEARCPYGLSIIPTVRACAG